MHSELYFVLIHFKTLSRYKHGCITFWTPFIVTKCQVPHS